MDRAWMLIVGQELVERDPPVKIYVGVYVNGLTFSVNGKYIVGLESKGVGVWQVEDGKRIARLEAESADSLAVSKDGRWIAAGTYKGEVLVWDAKTYDKVFSQREDGRMFVVNFSPDSTRLVSAMIRGDAIVWDIASGKEVQRLHHKGEMRAVRYSPRGDRIATGSSSSIRVWDSNDNRLLVEFGRESKLSHHGLLWRNDYLFVVFNGKIQQVNASTGSTISEWPIPAGDYPWHTALPQHEDFIACSTKHAVTFWDTATHTQLRHIQYPRRIDSIALSPDGQFLANCYDGGCGEFTIKSLSRTTASKYLI